MARKYLLAGKSLFVNSPKGIRSNAAVYDLQAVYFYVIRSISGDYLEIGPMLVITTNYPSPTLAVISTYFR